MLLVDDNRELLVRLADLLADYGFQIVGMVDRGELVLAAIDAAGPVDVVVMDVRMPGVDGLQATRWVKHANPGIEIILHTAFGGCLGDQAATVGAFAEVPKGGPPTDLIEAILAASGRQHSEHASTATGRR